MPGGCLLELSVQLAIVMVGKQAINTVKEMIIPLMWRYLRLLSVRHMQKVDVEKKAQNKWPRWVKDYKLVNFDPRGLFDEYLEISKSY